MSDLEKPPEVIAAEKLLSRSKLNTITGITQGICDVLNPILKDHAAKLRELEEKPTLRYVGVWKADFSYGIGAFATYDGSMWHCNRPTTDKPGTSDAWTLAVKRGRSDRR